MRPTINFALFLALTTCEIGPATDNKEDEEQIKENFANWVKGAERG
jgi:hypothetical protein